MKKIAENLWLLRYPLSVFGARLDRAVTLIRIPSGELIIHSTAPFTSADVKDIITLGQPMWLVEATLFHDTFAQAGRKAFPAIPYLVPEGFPAMAGAMQSLLPEPDAWRGQLETIELRGMPKLREHVFFHRPTRTLIVADFVFNLGPQLPAWTWWFFRWAGSIQQFPGMTRLFRTCIRDRTAFSESIRQLMRWDFDRLIVAHGDVIESGAKAKLAAALAVGGF